MNKLTYLKNKLKELNNKITKLIIQRFYLIRKIAKIEKKEPGK